MPLYDVKMFFDRPAVIRMVEKNTRRVLSRFGAYVRRTARSSIRKARQKKIAELTPKELKSYRRRQRKHRQGRGPKARRPSASAKPGKPPRYHTGLLRKILFIWDRYEQSVSIGPVVLMNSGRVPEVLEHGGQTQYFGEPMQIHPHPYMGPALDKEWPKLDDLWRDSVKR